MITLYDVLGAQPDDDAESLKNAFRDAVKTSHPDVHADDPHAVERFRQVVRANAILSDPDQRAVYDHLLEFERWQARAKTRRGLVLNTLRNLAADAITVVLLAALLGGGYLAFMHLSKTSVAAVGMTEMSAVSDAELTMRQPVRQEGSRLSREELHDLITGPGPSLESANLPSVVAGATEGKASVPIVKNPPGEPTPPARDETVIAVAEPVAKDAVAQSASALAAIETASAGQARENADGGATIEARSGDVKVSDPKDSDVQISDLKDGDVKISDAKDSGAKDSDAKDSDAKTGHARASEAQAGEAKSSDPKFYLERGTAFYRNGDLDRALADFDQAIQLDPSSASAYIDRSIVLYRKAEVGRAFADVAQASRIQDSLKAAGRPHRAAGASSRN